MMVMMMASTPSLNASNRPLVMVDPASPIQALDLPPGGESSPRGNGGQNHSIDAEVPGARIRSLNERRPVVANQEAVGELQRLSEGSRPDDLRPLGLVGEVDGELLPRAVGRCEPGLVDPEVRLIADADVDLECVRGADVV